MVATLNKSYRWAEFELEPDARRLSRGELKIHLTKKPFAILVYLIEHRDRIVTRDELLKEFWDGHDVYEETLTKSIGAIRKALGESSETPRFIETRWAEGYRFIGNIEKDPLNLKLLEQTHAVQVTIEENDQAPGLFYEPIMSILSNSPSDEETEVLGLSSLVPEPTGKRRTSKRLLAAGVAVLITGIAAAWGYYYNSASGAKRIDSIAVLPFVNQNSDADVQYLSDGISESISNSLSRLTDLKVMSRNSVAHYRGDEADSRSVAKELNVQAVLFGRMLQRGDSLTISVELINAEDNSKIWGQQYSRKLSDVFGVQEEIAKEISEKLRRRTYDERQLAKRPTDNLKAFQFYSQGRSFYARRTQEDMLKTIEYYEKAIAEDSNYALAYAGLADAYGALGVRGYIPPIEGRRKEEEYAQMAIGLDENLAEAHAALALPKIIFAPFDFVSGDRELKRAIELSPSFAAAHQYLGHSLTAQGRFEEAMGEYLKARELDPLSSIIARNVATSYLARKEYVRALDLLQQANELGPPFTNPLEIDVYIQNGRFDETLAELSSASKGRPNDPLLLYDTGMIYAAQGKQADARQVIRRLEEMSGTDVNQAQFIARIYAMLGQKEQALEWLQRGLDAGQLAAIGQQLPVWDGLREDPRFIQLLIRAGLPTN